MTAIYESRDAANAATEKLKIFAQPQRLMILSHLMQGERTVGDIDEATSIGQPALSQQLAALRRAGVVETRRMAKQIYYRLANDTVVTCVRSIEGMFNKNAPLQTTVTQPATHQIAANQTTTNLATTLQNLEKPARKAATHSTAGAARFAQIL